MAKETFSITPLTGACAASLRSASQNAKEDRKGVRVMDIIDELKRAMSRAVIHGKTDSEEEIDVKRAELAMALYDLCTKSHRSNSGTLESDDILITLATVYGLALGMNAKSFPDAISIMLDLHSTVVKAIFHGKD